MQSAEPMLVWAPGRLAPVAHGDPDCPTLAERRIPRRNQPYEGPGSVGWVSRVEALTLRNSGSLRFCEVCT
jgi:hypothetical protein